MHPQSTEQQTATVRVAFDVMAGIEPMTFPSTTATAQITDRLRAAFLAADVIRDGHKFDVVIENTEMGVGTVKVLVDGSVIEHGSITRVDEQPPAKPDYWLTLADDLRQAADRIATLAGTDTRPAHVTLNVLGSVLNRDAERMVPLVDAIAAAFDTTAAISREHRDQHRARAEVGAVQFQAYTFVPKPEDPEKAAMRAELDALRAQLAEGGATR